MLCITLYPFQIAIQVLYINHTQAPTFRIIRLDVVLIVGQSSTHEADKIRTGRTMPPDVSVLVMKTE